METEKRVKSNTISVQITFILGLFVGAICSQTIQSLFELFESKSDLFSITTEVESDEIIQPRHWCMIQNNTVQTFTEQNFSQFPHTAEIILSCYSYFSEKNATKNCGLYLEGRRFRLNGWSKELVDAMGCKTVARIEDIPEDDIQYSPNLYLLRPRLNQIQYLNHPDHAHELRRLFVNDTYIETQKGVQFNHPIQIGIIQRKSGRVINNLDDIINALQLELETLKIDYNINLTFFDYSSIKEQATWFATKDIIIGAHGAAMTNSLFITPKTIVMQLYPPGFFYAALEPLIEQAGGIAIQWYEKGPNPYIKFRTLSPGQYDTFCIPEGGLVEERRSRDLDIAPPVDDVVNHILYASGIKNMTRDDMKSLFGVDYS